MTRKPRTKLPVKFRLLALDKNGEVMDQIDTDTFLGKTSADKPKLYGVAKGMFVGMYRQVHIRAIGKIQRYTNPRRIAK